MKQNIATAVGGKEFSCALSREKDWAAAVRACARKAAQDLEGTCDLALIFVSDFYADFKAEALSGLIRESLASRVLIGCNASGVIGGGEEVEMEPAVSLMAMRLPKVQIHPFYLSATEVKAAQKAPQLIEALDIYPVDKPKFLLLADGMSCDADKLCGLFNQSFPGAPVIGGLASGAAAGRPNWLILNQEVFDSGALGVGLSGPVEFEVVVAQGCRPIGESFIITKAQEHVLYELGGRPAFEVLQELVAALPPQDRTLARHSLFVGLAMDERRRNFKRGDFLIRNLMGYDPKSGALMVGANLKAGHTVQFQLRDKKTSAQDLGLLLEQLGSSNDKAAGAFLVSCCGRGRGLYGEAGHDSGLIQKMKGPLPLAGFFANGEIGPVGARNFVHGYTSSLAIIR